MAWIKAEQSLRNHPKMRKAAAMLEIAEPHMVGYLLYLWWWAVDYATDGDLGKYTHEDIEFAVAWRGVNGAFVAACLECGFGDGPGFLDNRDGGLKIHDWHDFAGALIQSRQHTNEQVRKHRELYNDKELTTAIKSRDADICRYCGCAVVWRDRKSATGATYDYIDPEGSTTYANIVVACRGCNSAKGRRTPAQAGMKLRKPPVENLQKSTGNLQKPADINPSSTQRVEKSREEREEQQYQSADATEIVTFWQNNIGTIGKFARDKLIAYVTDDGMESALVIYAIEKAIAANVRRLDYVEAILKDWAAENIKTRAVAEAQQRPRSAAGGGDGEKPYRPLKVHR